MAVLSRCGGRKGIEAETEALFSRGSDRARVDVLETEKENEVAWNYTCRFGTPEEAVEGEVDRGASAGRRGQEATVLAERRQRQVTGPGWRPVANERRRRQTRALGEQRRPGTSRRQPPAVGERRLLVESGRRRDRSLVRVYERSMKMETDLRAVEEMMAQLGALDRSGIEVEKKGYADLAFFKWMAGYQGFLKTQFKQMDAF
uniref:Uncharacterized protein n=1 Tax=Leersia perrieri TaxID=77586 RepID=A0A0D9XE72_9ORYZ